MLARLRSSIVSISLLLVVLGACNSTPSTPADAAMSDAAVDAPATGDTGGSDATPPDGTSTADASMIDAAPMLHTPECQDESITALNLFDSPAPTGKVRDESVGGEGYTRTFVDTAGGGLSPTESYVYVRFTDSGLEQLPISDEDAFANAEWDIGLRRFVVRLNSGVSGPSSVVAGRTAPGTTFADLASVPSGLTYHEEQYFTDTCDFVPDGSGLGSSPGGVLASYYNYTSCVAMTGNVYVIRTRAGRHVKFEVLSYYSPANQMLCNTMNRIETPSGAGAMRFRWAFLPS